ncbi:hypothetical protein K443DRAFT_677778 [Laccaria amethystina LaAM-08-1]|uniref:CAP-Gly domain-containing protein n=1 Tax=Laccaria amethystina LaAM-08-1 TaxID=1095629 RepID=A0A0C9XX73_9AGAR|nr:hypothetical protein K443DRAFT_677778 [Laccaria amethystina LaAM-08-1]
MDPSLGTIVTIPQGRGVVRFIGPTSFAIGKWVGVELYEPNGKNDGSVNGIHYFTCKLNYGVFIRQSQIKGVHGSELDAGPSTVPKPPPPTTRPTMGHQRTSSASGLLRANSFRSPPSSNPSSNPSPRSTSPVKPVVAPVPTTLLTTPAALGSRLAKPPPASPTKRTPPLSLQPRKSLAFRSASQEAPTSASRESPPNILSPNSTAPRTSSPLTLPPRQASPPPQPPSPSHLGATPANGRPSSRAASPPGRPPADEQELQELRAKVRVLEAKRTDDARHVRELETRLSEAESFVALRPKLQAKLNSLQTELIATRRELSDSLQLSQLSDTRVADAQEHLEMAMLDKEVAEERAELAETELEEIKEKLAVLEVENGVLKEGGGTGESSDDTAKSSMAYIQLEKHNERLKEALIKLRDLSQETEQEQRRRISEMEKDIVGIDELQSQYEESLIKLSNAETQIEDLKLQLDDALGAEEMLVQLTERNLMLGEKIEEMRITIEDLEALKELNDELEENHMETEKQLHEDLDRRDMQIREHVHKIETLEETCLDLENTINQFRELVMQLQSDLDSLRAQTQSAQSESDRAASQTAAMMSLNLKLQSSASKNQARSIDLELAKWEAKEHKEMLEIVQPYLPQIYVESDNDATRCYMFFQRMAAKVDLINMVVTQAHGLPDALNGPVSEALVGICEMRGRVSGLSTLCKRFAAILRKCDVETFLNIGRLYPEIAPLEKRIDMHIGLLRRDDFKEGECVNDIVKIQAQFDHLAETYFDGFDYDLAERELGYLMALDLDLDMCSASLRLTKTAVEATINDKDVELDMGGYDIDLELFEPLLKLLEQCKGAKTLSKKLTKRLEDLIQDSTALKAHLIPQMKALSDHVADLVNFGFSLAQGLMPHLGDARSAKSALQLTTVLGIVKQTATSTVAKDMKPGASTWEAVGGSIRHLTEEGSKLLPLVLENENVLKITGVAPWVTRIAEVKAALAVNIEAERKVASLNDEMQGLVRTLRAKDQNIQEATVKIELMERRMETVKKQADTIVDLETEINKGKKQERAYEEAIEQLQADIDAIEQENARLKSLSAGQERQQIGTQPVETENVPIEGSLETSYLLDQIEALRGTVRYLRTENSFLKGQDLLREIESLSPLPQPISRMPTPPLDPSGNSDTDDFDSEINDSPPTLRTLTTETKMLYRDVIKFSSSPRVVDLSALNTKRAEAKGGKVWLPKKKSPSHQIWERKAEAERLNRRVHGLMERASAIGAL